MYDVAPGGEDLLGWHVNQGPDQEALFYPVSHFRYDYYRPDVIDRIMETLDEEEALRKADAFANRRTSTRRDITKKLPPSVSILNPISGSPISTNTVDLEYSIISPNNEPITDLKVLIDGRPSPENRGIRPNSTRGKLSVSIPSRNCRLSLLAKNRFGSSEAAVLDLEWKGELEPDLYKPNLYVLAIGVSDYDDSEYRLDFAAKDAKDFVASIQKQEGKLYKEVIPKLLTNKKANRINILKGLEWLQKETTQHDVAMLFFAGHGLEDNSGTFYFLPKEANAENLIYNGIMKEHIKETVKTISGKVLVFMDACHSGYLMTTTSRRRGGPNMTRVINELRDAENGAIVFSSSTGRQYSLEDSRWKNGAFTKALVEGMNGAADLFGIGKITCKTLDTYITNRVKELTKGEQSPTTNFPPNVEDFPIGIKD